MATFMISPDGRLIWYSTYLSYGEQAPIDMALDTQGNVYATGFANSGWGGAWSGSVTVKYAPDGTELWARRSDLGLWDLALDLHGNVYVTGVARPLEVAGHEAVTVKYSAQGQEVWSHRMDLGLIPDSLYGWDTYTLESSVDASGNTYVWGHKSAVQTRDIGFLASFDSAGAQRWTAHDFVFRPERVTAVEDGGAYVTGYCNDCEGGEGRTVSLDENGEVLWEVPHKYVWLSGHSIGQDGFISVFGEAISQDPPHLRSAMALVVSPTGTVASVTDVPMGDAENFGAQVGWHNLFVVNDETVSMYHEDGSQAWTSSIENSNLELIGIVKDEGRIVVGGSVRGSKSGDVLAVSFDTTGAIQWQYRYDSPPESYTRSVAITTDSNGEPVILGEDDPGNCCGLRPTSILAKYSPDGSERWIRRIDRPNPDALISNHVGGYFFAGRDEGAYWDGKLDGEGNEEWVRELVVGTQDWPQEAARLAVSPEGDVALLGAYGDSRCYVSITDTSGESIAELVVENDPCWPGRLDFDHDGKLWVAFKSGNWISWRPVILKLDRDGSELWKVELGSDHRRATSNMELHRDGGAVVTIALRDTLLLYKLNSDGEIDSESRYTGATGTLPLLGIVGSGEVAVAGRNKVALLGLDGTERWSRPRLAGGEASELHVDSEGNVFVAGTVYTFLGPADYLVEKYTPDGNIHWLIRYDSGHGAQDEFAGMALDDSGTAYVTGTSTSDHLGVVMLTLKLGGASSQTRLEDEVPKSDVMHLGIYPNPFSSQATISFRMSVGGMTRLSVFDSIGREVSILNNSELPPGAYEFDFDPGATADGVYLVRLVTPLGRVTKTLVRLH